MAHLITGYAGYEHISSADDGAFNASFFGEGQYVMDFGNCFAGSIIDNNTVRISDGNGLMYGRHFRIDTAYEDVTIKTGTAGKNRIDLICMTYEKDSVEETEKVYLQVIEGTAVEGTASVPAYTNGKILEGATLNQMPLYEVVIKGVVLSKIVPIYEKIQSYEKLAQKYEDKFEQTCEDAKNELKKQMDEIIYHEDVVNNLESTKTDVPLSANQGRVISERIAELEKFHLVKNTDNSLTLICEEQE